MRAGEVSVDEFSLVSNTELHTRRLSDACLSRRASLHIEDAWDENLLVYFSTETEMLVLNVQTENN